MKLPNWKHERACAGPVAGVDEAGRGPLAGPVVAAAVIFRSFRAPKGVDDSKKLCAKARADLCAKISAIATVGVGVASVEEIDRINIYWATMLAMTRAVEAMGVAPAMVLVDGNGLPKWSWTAKAIVGGDALCTSIAAASIVAKHHRDQMMIAADAAHPGYGWASNKGYGCKHHLTALRELGPTPLHRRSFAPVAQAYLPL